MAGYYPAAKDGDGQPERLVESSQGNLSVKRE